MSFPSYSLMKGEILSVCRNAAVLGVSQFYGFFSKLNRTKGSRTILFNLFPPLLLEMILGEKRSSEEMRKEKVGMELNEDG